MLGGILAKVKSLRQKPPAVNRLLKSYPILNRGAAASKKSPIVIVTGKQSQKSPIPELRTIQL
jgi:hypothetical protein